MSISPQQQKLVEAFTGSGSEVSKYYIDIYRSSLERVAALSSQSGTPTSPDNMVVVDFGGGHGMLSILAKQMGFGRVVYIDRNPDAQKSLAQLSEHFGTKPDVILQGDAETLKTWCRENGETPDALLAMDVIEHIYVLDEFFSALHDISPQMNMLFTTASTPYNKRVVRRLHHAMNLDEFGHDGKKGFRTLRREHIQQLHPDMSNKQLDYWAENTRGLIYEDVERAVDAQTPNLLRDPYNTCDPETGSWTERILPVEDYLQILLPYGYSLHVFPGRYNIHRNGPKEWASKYYNSIIDKAPQNEPEGRRERCNFNKALKVAPFIYLIAQPTNRDL